MLDIFEIWQFLTKKSSSVDALVDTRQNLLMIVIRLRYSFILYQIKTKSDNYKRNYFIYSCNSLKIYFFYQ